MCVYNAHRIMNKCANPHEPGQDSPSLMSSLDAHLIYVYLLYGITNGFDPGFG